MTNAVTPSRDIQSVALSNGRGGSFSLSQDAFGRLRVSTPTTVFDTKQTDLDVSPYVMQNYTVAGGTTTYSSSRSSRTLTGSAIGDEAYRVSSRRFRYEPGTSNEVKMSFRLVGYGSVGDPLGGYSRVGMFDTRDGVFLEARRNEFRNSRPDWSITLRNSASGAPVDIRLNTGSYLIDGFGRVSGEPNPSGISIDLRKVQILHISFEWLGVGGILVSFVLDNQVLPHCFYPAANAIESVSMRTPNLPLRWDTRGVSSIESICASVQAEGDVRGAGLVRADYNTTGVATAVAGDIVEVMSIRLRSNGTADGDQAITSATVFIEGATLLNSTGDDGMLLLGYAPSFTGAGTWQNPVGGLWGPLSHVQVCKSGRVVTNPGHVMAASMFSSSNQQGGVSREAFDRVLALGTRFPDSSAHYGVSDVVSLMHMNLSGGATTTRGTLTWRELQ